MSRASSKWMAGVLGLWLVTACDGGDNDPSPKPDTVQSQDVPLVDAGTDAVAQTDVSADGITGTTDATAEVSPPQDTSTTCSAPCMDSDSNPCTIATCEAGQCVQRTVADGSSCEDGNPCTTADTCKAGQCTPSSASGTNTCACEANADCTAQDDALLCNGQFFCDKSAFPFTCKVNPASIPPCDVQTPPSPCLTGGCAEPTVGGGKAQCIWKPLADGSVCDDGNPLTAGDTCLQGVCLAGQFIGSCQNNSECAQFEDGNLCNGQLFCNKAKGQCQLNPATVIACPTSADTVCAKNTCEPTTGKCALLPTAEGQSCEDGNDCTTGEACQDGLCAGATNTCSCAADADCVAQEDDNLCNGKLFCNLQVGQCQINPATVVNCGEADAPCQLLACEPTSGKCVTTPDLDGTPCNADNTLCTVADSCQQGTCKAGDNLCKCTKTADCGLYEDGDQCNGQLYCNLQIGACELNPATVVTCDNTLDTACAMQVCVPLSGQCTAVVQNNGGGCDDGDACTMGDMCADGSCLSGQTVCACQQDADCAADEDGNFCNGTLYCDKVSATCKLNPSTIVSCVDALPGDCTAVVCEPATGLCIDVSVTVGTGCEDGDVCTVASKCDAQGECSDGFDSCGCSSDLDCADQDDGDACNGAVRCDFSTFPVPQCALVAPQPCAAGPCEVAVCDSQSGQCVVGPAAPNADCEDGDPCTLASACSETGCVGAQLHCDDNEPCTIDWCGEGKCQHQALADKLPCDDGDLCTPVDACFSGACVHSDLACDDNNPCTDDGCDSGNCVFAANSSICDDNDPCTQDDVCGGGACGGIPTVCNAPSGPCLVGACGPGGACYYTAGFEGAVCNDETPCTATAVCKSGQCTRVTTKVCDDGDPCSSDPTCDDEVPEGCSESPPADGNPDVYWTVTAIDDFNWWHSLTWHPQNKEYAALHTTSTGDDPLLRIWPGAGQAPTDFALSYPGSNAAYRMLDDGKSGWLVVGDNGSAVDPNAPRKPLLMQVDGAGKLTAVSTGLGEGLVFRALAHLDSKDPNFGKHIMVAGSLSPAGNTSATQLWLGEVDLSLPSSPKVVRSATCSTTSSGPQQIGTVTWHGTELAQLTNGDWIVGGYVEVDEFQFTSQYPALCHFDANLALVGEPVRFAGGGETLQLTARPDGGYWWLTNDGAWLAYTAEGHLLRSVNAGWGAKKGVVQGNAMWLASNNDGFFGVSLAPFTDSQEGGTAAFSGQDGSALGLVRDDTGMALLYSDEAGLHLQHMDADFHQTCGEATDCAGACLVGGACAVPTCNEGECDLIQFFCDDNNDCTLDSCGDGGCQYSFAEAVSCDDNQPCTELDSCVNGQCKGQSPLGASATTVAATEEIVDGVMHGDGLLVIGNREVDGQAQAFWRLYSATRAVTAEGTIAAGSAVRMARRKSELTGDGGFNFAATVAVVVKSPAAETRMWYVNPFASQVTEGYALALQDSALHSLVQENDGTVLALTASNIAWEVYRYPPGQPPVAYLTNVVPDIREVHLLPMDEDWIVVHVDNAPTGLRVLFWRFDQAGAQVGFPATQNLGEQSLTTDPICPYAARVMQGVQLVCAGAQAQYFNPQEQGTVQAMPDTLAVNYNAQPSPLVAATSQAAVSLVKAFGEEQFVLVPQDGFFNAGPVTVQTLATKAPVLAANAYNIWFVTETETGTTRQVTVHHLDRYGNSSCDASGSCSQQTCEDINVCTIVGCSAGVCSNTTISDSGNCGPEGPCSTCVPK